MLNYYESINDAMKILNKHERMLENYICWF
jgi:hypothetical protein